jgi:hypothetical protein
MAASRTTRRSFRLDDIDRQLWEIDENLMRAELTQTELLDCTMRAKAQIRCRAPDQFEPGLSGAAMTMPAVAMLRAAQLGRSCCPQRVTGLKIMQTQFHNFINERKSRKQACAEMK